jgi:hypothetical protein
LIFPGMQGNILFKSKIYGRNTIELVENIPGTNEIYTLSEFALSKEKETLFGAISNTTYLTQKQIEMIQSTAAGDKLFLVHVRYTDPDGRIHEAPVKEIIIEE